MIITLILFVNAPFRPRFSGEYQFNLYYPYYRNYSAYGNQSIDVDFNEMDKCKYQPVEKDKTKSIANN